MHLYKALKARDCYRIVTIDNLGTPFTYYELVDLFSTEKNDLLK